MQSYVSGAKGDAEQIKVRSKACIDLLAQFGATDMATLPPAQYAPALSALQALQAAAVAVA